MRISSLRLVGIAAALLTGVGVPLLVAQESVSSGITFQDLLQGYKNPARWLNFSGDYSGQRHSPLKQITPANAHTLTAQWAFQTGVIPRRGFEGTPLVADGVMYLTGPFNNAWALDARTGRPFWPTATSPR
jgi:alcohol dehydrogenase (cytochrome c)